MAENNAVEEESSNGASSPSELLYKPPAQKSVQEILETDKDDESLVKYKQTLLGGASADVVLDADNPKNVLVRRLVLLVDGRGDVVMELSDPKGLEERTFSIKEGCHYRLRIDFHVQREIVAGLKYVQKVLRHGIPVDKDRHMVGSYPPNKDMHSFTTPVEEAPSGMLHRGTFKIKSLFTDDDKHEWLSWEWKLEIKKDWD